MKIAETDEPKIEDVDEDEQESYKSKTSKKKKINE